MEAPQVFVRVQRLLRGAGEPATGIAGMTMIPGQGGTTRNVYVYTAVVDVAECMTILGSFCFNHADFTLFPDESM